MTKCVSPVEDGSRCQRESIGNSLFCKEHIYHKRDYIKYKKLETNLSFLMKKWPPKKKIAVKRLLRVYNTLQGCYTLRVEYRKKAFVKEAWDRGHDLRISILWGYMEDYLSVLEEKFKEENDRVDIFEPFENTSSNVDLILSTQTKNKTKKIRKIRKRIVSIEEQFNTEIPKAIQLRKEQQNKIELVLNKYEALLIEILSSFYHLSEIKPGLFRFYIVVFRYHEMFRTGRGKFSLKETIYIRETSLDLKIDPLKNLVGIKVEDYIRKMYTSLVYSHFETLLSVYHIHSKIWDRGETLVSIKRVRGGKTHNNCIFKLYSYIFPEANNAFIVFPTVSTIKGMSISNKQIKRMSTGPNRVDRFVPVEEPNTITEKKQQQAIDLLRGGESFFYKENLLGNISVFVFDLTKRQVEIILDVNVGRGKGIGLDHLWDQIIEALKHRKG